MTILTPPGWLQNAGSTHTAVQLRQYFGGLQAGNFSSSTSLRSRGGIHPSLGQEFFVQQAGSPNMTVLVESGVASIPGTESGAQGNYLVCNDGQVILSIAAAHATLARIDIVVVNVRDSVYSGASNDAQLQVVTGTPASSPVAPSAPNNAIIIAQVAVGAAVSSITNANITDTRFYMAGTGGVILARNDAARPAAAEIAEGQLVWGMANNTLYVWDGSAYEDVWPSAWTTWTPSLTNLTLGSGTLTGRYRKRAKTLDFHFKFKYGAGSAVGTSPRFNIPSGLTLHSSYVALEDIPCATVMLYDSGTANHLGTIRVFDNDTFEIMSVSTAGATPAEINTTSTVPFTWTTNDVISVSASGIELA